MRSLWLAPLLAACPPREPEWAFPDPTSGPALLGPGGPNTTFDASERFALCGYADVGEDDPHDVHNGLYPWRGYAVMPYARDFGDGGVAVFDVSDPCAPVVVGSTRELSMRETHTAAFVHRDGHDWLVATDLLGLQIWSLDDPADPVMVTRVPIEGVTILPGSYPRTVHTAFLQDPWLYVAAADSGLYVVDLSDLAAPIVSDPIVFEPPLRVGFVYALGDLLFVAGSEESEAIVLQITGPGELSPIPGGRFAVADAGGTPREAYSGSVAGPYALFARTEEGSGVVAYDWTHPEAPVYVGDVNTVGNGGYVFHDEGRWFIGESDVARVFDATDPAAPVLLGEITMHGDLDTLMPYGNVAFLSADEDAADGEATAVIPIDLEPDSKGPSVMRVVPADGASVGPNTRIGVAFDEFIEPTTAFEGSLRLYDADGAPVRGVVSAQESIATYVPTTPLLPGTYTATVEAGGVRDANDNTIEETWSWTFTVGP
jgi:hypothetical protein